MSIVFPFPSRWFPNESWGRIRLERSCERRVIRLSSTGLKADKPAAFTPIIRASNSDN